MISFRSSKKYTKVLEFNVLKIRILNRFLPACCFIEVGTTQATNFFLGCFIGEVGI